MTTSDVIAIIALIVSLAAFVWPEILRYWSRPNLNLFLRVVNFIDAETKKEELMLQVLMINDGYRPIIISQCEYISSPNNGKGNIGIYDTLKAPYGKHDIVLPILLEPAKSHELNIFRAAVLTKENHTIDSIYVIDAKGRKYYISNEELADAKRQTISRLANKNIKA